MDHKSTVVEIISYEQYKAAVSATNYVIIDFFSTYCEPCKELAPIYEKLSEIYTTISFYKLNCDTRDANLKVLIKTLKITVVPSIYLFSSGKLISIIGTNELSEYLEKL